jgi:hypothetical protein
LQDGLPRTGIGLNQVTQSFHCVRRTVCLGQQLCQGFQELNTRLEDTCVLALTLSWLLQRSLHQQGIDLSLPRLLDLPGGVRETLVIYPKKRGQHQPATARTVCTLSNEQEQLLSALNLRRYL